MEYINAGLDFFFDMIKWVFTYFLIEIKIFDISLLYYFFSLLILGFVIGGLINSVSAGNWVYRSSNFHKNKNKGKGSD